MIGMINNLSWYPKVNQSIGCLKMQYRNGLWLHLVLREKIWTYLLNFAFMYWIYPGPELQPSNLICHNFLSMDMQIVHQTLDLKNHFLHTDYLIYLLISTNVIKKWPKILETLLSIKSSYTPRSSSTSYV